MLTIECPNCKRGLRAPQASGEDRVLCPACNAAFAVVFEGGAVRAVSTSVVDELPSAKSADNPQPILEDRGPPQWIPSILPYVTNDAVARRTRRLFWTFVNSTVWIFAYSSLTGGLEDQLGKFSGIQLAGVAFCSVLLGGLVMLFVGIFIMPQPIEKHEKGAEILRRLNELAPPFHADPGWVRETPESTDADMSPTSEPQPDRPT